MPARMSSPQASGCSTVPAALGAAPACLTRSSRSASVRRGDTPDGVHDSWLAESDTLTRRCGRCCIAMASLGVKRSPREPARRYEWPCPGDLLHMDTARHARFQRPGHAVIGVRDQTGAEKRAPRSAWAGAMTSLTQLSMTILAWPTSSCCRTNEQQRSPRSPCEHSTGSPPVASTPGTS
jgi:hypothetical protein